MTVFHRDYESKDPFDELIAAPQEKPRECLPGGVFRHAAPDSSSELRGPVHWQTCEIHKVRWYWGQNVMTVPPEYVLRGKEREEFFREYTEGHCPGFEDEAKKPEAKKPSEVNDPQWEREDFDF